MIIEKFTQIVRQYPTKIAVKTIEEQVTYSELDCLSSRLALHLEQGNGRILGILPGHGCRQVTGALGALKAGIIYVPLDSRYPLKRLQYMTADSGIDLILADKATNSLAQELVRSAPRPVGILDFETIAGGSGPAGKTTTTSLPSHNFPGHTPAYILYTSGSTGKPKGVVQSRGGTFFFAQVYAESLSIRPDDRVTYLSSFSHDGALQDIYPTLLSGATLCALDIRQEQGINRLASWLLQENITIYHSVPTILRYMMSTLTGEDRYPRLRLLVTGGEPLRLHDILEGRRLFPSVTMAHMYGQTESSVNTMGFIDTSQKIENITLGEPLGGVRLLLVNEKGEEADPMEEGEIIVATPHVAIGYWNHVDTTARVFLHHPEFGRMYRSGDLGRLRLDGSIEFLGRKDNQLKIRGFRVETGEIENHLLAHREIKEAAVIDRVGDNGDIYLCAYFVKRRQAHDNEQLPAVTLHGSQGSDISSQTGQSLEANLRDYLSRILPDYMVPAYFVELDRLPRTGSGKLDRKALPHPQPPAASRYVPPAGEIERKLLSIWAGVLAVPAEKIGVEGSFFEFGGHSLKAVTLVARAHRELGVNVPLEKLFAAPTVRRMAAYIEAAGPGQESFSAIDAVEKKEYYPLSFNQKRLWFIHQMAPRSAAFHLPLSIKLQEAIDKNILIETFRYLMRHHESLRTRFAKVPGRDDFEPMQFIEENPALPIEEIDISYLSGAVKEAERQQIYSETAGKPFDLTQAPLFRVVLLKLEPRHYELICNIHHIVTDGWSMEVLRKDFGQVYEALLAAKEPQLPPLTIQYKDFAEWNNRRLADPHSTEMSCRYWEKIIGSGLPTLILPRDFPGGRDKGSALQPVQDITAVTEVLGAAYHYWIGQATAEALRELAGKNNTSLFMVMFSAFLVLLAHFSRQEQVVCSIIGAGRQHIDLHHVIGFFVNSIPFTATVDRSNDFTAFLKAVNRDVLEVFRHQSYPLEDVFGRLKQKYPNIPVSFNMLNIQDFTRETELDSFEPYHIAQVKDVKFDIEPYITEYRSGIDMYWTYKKRFFSTAVIEKMAREYTAILEYYLEHPQDNIFAYRKKEKIQQIRRNKKC